MIGTPRTTSMNTMLSARMAGIRERRPRASATAGGNAAANPTVDRTHVSGRPPQDALGTSARPRILPRSSTIAAMGTAIQRPSSQGFHHARTALAA